MDAVDSLSVEERKALVEVLTFRAVEESVLKHYKLRNPGKIARLIRKKWRKVLPLVGEESLVLSSELEPAELKHILDSLSLYSQLYTDLIDPYAASRCQRCIEKLMDLKAAPSLAAQTREEIDRIVAVRPGPKKKKERPLPVLGAGERPHLNPRVRGDLVAYFKKRLRESEPMLMVDPRFRLRIDNIYLSPAASFHDMWRERGGRA